MVGVLKTTRVQPPSVDPGSLTDAPEEPSSLASAGEQIAGRYLLFSTLGRGGHGEVWEALDTLSGERVAVKLLPNGRTGLRVRNEVSALRLMQVPGVVRLYDEGIDTGRPFLVMDRVQGRHFPGAGRTWTWASLEHTTTALLETLARLHAAGVVHRDIKPGNVLVDADGRPTLLDFGLAFASPWDSVADRTMAGTPAYMAPEQMAGDPAEPCSDLYSVGVMLYEALSGALPFEGLAIYALVYAKANENLRPIRTVAPGVPTEVARAIDRMVMRDPAQRPASAAEVLRMLKGEHTLSRGGDAIVALGNGEVLRELVAAVREGQSVDVVGPRGAGRTWTLRALAAALRSSGREVVAVQPMRRSFPSVPGGARASDRGIGDVAPGTVLLADDHELLDDATQTSLDDARGHAVVVRALLPEHAVGGDGEVWLRPLTEAELRAIFVGPERVFHLPSDAARALWDRTDATAARVAAELAAWVRAGLARRDGAKVSVDREALDRLASGHRLAPVIKGATHSRQSIEPRVKLLRGQEELLVWMNLAWPHTSTATLAAAMGVFPDALEVDARVLLHAGAVRQHEDGRWVPAVAVVVEAVWDASRRAAAHRALASALAPGTEGRMVHLVAGAEGADGDAVAVALEAVAVAHARRTEGRLGRALAALAEGLMAARRAGAPGLAEQEVLTTWVEIALDEATPRALDRVRYELSRAVYTPRVEQLARLVEAAQAARAGGDRGIDMLEAMAPFEQVSLELRRQNVRVAAARRSTLGRETRAVAEATAWASGVAGDVVAGMTAEWVSRLRYREGRYAEAAALLAEAAQRETDPTRRLSLKRGVAVQWLEAHRHQEARQWATQVRDEARRLRNPHAECFGEYLLRAVAYRMNNAGGCDLELVEAAQRLGVADIEALVSFNEAVVAWRADDSVAAELLGRVQRIFGATGWRPGAMLARAVACTLATEADGHEVSMLASMALGEELPGLALQVLALLARATGKRDDAWVARAKECVAAMATVDPAVRLEVLSVAECVEALGL